jgi:hypothetical protein
VKGAMKEILSGKCREKKSLYARVFQDSSALCKQQKELEKGI